MRASSHASSFLDSLPEGLTAGLARLGLRLLGVALLGVAGLLIAALATWTIDDPSLSHAVARPVRNVLGWPGAVVADLAMQILGLASIAVVIPFAAFALRLAAARPLARERLRVLIWLFGIAAFAGAVSSLPVNAGWPLPTGFGGVIGDGILSAPGHMLGPLDGFARFVTGVVCLALAVPALLVACGGHLPERKPAQEKRRRPIMDDDMNDDRRSAFVGGLTHALYAAPAQTARALRFGFAMVADLVGRAAARREVRAPDLPLRRREPRFEDMPRPEPRIEPRLPADSAASISRPTADRTPEPMPEPVAPAFIGEDEEEATAPPPRAAREAKPKAVRTSGRPTAVTGGRDGAFRLPPPDLLAQPKASERALLSVEAIQESAACLEGVLDDFGIRGEIINARPGPVVTLYELEPAPGIKSSRVVGLADDIARSMSAVSARVAVVPGRNVIGIELPNPKREKVYLRELLASPEMNNAGARLPLCLGKTIGGEPVIVDLARMPHLLIAGTTGSGKSVAINTMILSLLYRLTPEQCRLIMVDPKMLELSVYDDIPHLLTPVVTDPKKAVVALKWAVREMEERYRKMSKLGVRNIDGFNQRIAEARARGEALTRTVQTGFDRETGEAIYEREEMDLAPLPYVVVVVDEMADLMMVAGKEIEGAIQRLAQMARAAGIHVILATQRPSVDVITGTIKANFPTRISFQVTSKIDSRTILGEQGAEQLLGQGDMLYMAGGGRISRVHGPFVSDDEVEKVVRHLKAQGAPDYLHSVTADEEEDAEGSPQGSLDFAGEGADEGDLYKRAVGVVLRDRKASTSYIQRRLQIGYNRAASLMERMEKEGIVGPANHAGKREILNQGADAG